MKKQQQKQQVQKVVANTLLTPKWKQRTHDTNQKHLEQYSGKSFKVAFLGDSMMERWLTTGAEFWNKNFSEYANLGVGGDGIEHLLYRIGILDSIKVDKIILMIGTNNSEKRSSDHICEGIAKVIDTIFEKAANTELIVYGLTNRTDVTDNKMKEINDKLEAHIKSRNNQKITYRLFCAEKTDLVDNVHMNETGYSKWFDDMTIIL